MHFTQLTRNSSTTSGQKWNIRSGESTIIVGLLGKVKHNLKFPASLALWAGGNELENLELAQIRDSHRELFPKYLAEYEQLFLHTIGVTVFENTRSISYTPSSTSNGWAKLDFSKAQPITQRYYNVSRDEVHGDTGIVLFCERVRAHAV
jgi:hypothetical protein